MEYVTQAWEWSKQAAAWAYHHPEFWPVVTALVVMLCKPRSPAEYAKIAERWPTAFWSRWVELMRLVGALGLDPIKVVKVLRKLLGKDDGGSGGASSGGGTGGGEIRATPSKFDGKGPPSGPSIIGAAAVASALLLCTQFSCREFDSPRSAARAAVATIARAGKAADLACGTAAIHVGQQDPKKGVEIAYACGDAYDSARLAALGVEELVDAWDDAAADRFPCALRDAMQALGQLAKLTQKHGGSIPKAVDDAALFAEPFAAACLE